MEVVEAKQELADNNGNVVLGDKAGLHQVGAAAARAKLHDDPELGPLGKGPKVLGDVGRLQLGQDGNFLDDVLDLILCTLNVDNLDGDSLASTLVDTVYRAESAVADRAQQDQLTL